MQEVNQSEESYGVKELQSELANSRVWRVYFDGAKTDYGISIHADTDWNLHLPNGESLTGFRSEENVIAALKILHGGGAFPPAYST